MSKIPFSISDRSLTFYVGGDPYSVDRSSPAWEELKALVQADEPDVQKLIALTNPIVAVQTAVDAVEALDYLPRGVVSVTRDAIKYNGEVLHGVLVDRIFDMLSEGFDIMPMVRFLENLMMNPADFARDELYLWLENSDLPITEDGHFLAYKLVRSNFTSTHDGVTKNDPGLVVEMTRQAVDQARYNTCSTGLHFCSKSYLPLFGDWNRGKAERTVLLKVNPADVVSIPSDYDNAKGRAWKYLVLEEVTFDIPTRVWGSVYSSDTALLGDEDEDLDDDFDYDEVELLTFPSNLAGALYAAISGIGISTRPEDRVARLDWANDTLYDLDAAFYETDFITSFKQLTVDQAGILLGHANDIQAENDRAAEDAVEEAAEVAAHAHSYAADASDLAKQAAVDAINGYGIITLRTKAAAAGFKGAWKGPKAADLRKFLIEQV